MIWKKGQTQLSTVFVPANGLLTYGKLKGQNRDRKTGWKKKHHAFGKDFLASAFYRIYNKEQKHCWVVLYTLFFIRTSNFDAEAERSHIFWRFEAETFLKMFLNLQKRLDGVETFLEHYKKNYLCNKQTIVTVTQNKPFSIWVNLHFCTFIFLPVV